MGVGKEGPQLPRKLLESQQVTRNRGLATTGLDGSLINIAHDSAVNGTVWSRILRKPEICTTTKGGGYLRSFAMEAVGSVNEQAIVLTL